MSVIYTVLAFVLALGPLIVLHELGHYVVARLCNVKVLRFSVGMGRVVWSRRFGPDQTEWAVSMLPLGGYVKMLDSRDPETAPKDESELHREFTRQSVWRRIAIVAAGPIANFLVAIGLMAALFMHGVEEPSARLRSAPQGTAAQVAGVRGGDTVIAVNGNPVQSWSELRWQIVHATVDKGDARLELRSQGGGSYHATIPASSIAKLDVEGDVAKELGLDLWRARARIEKVMPGGAGERAGLQPGDLVVSADGKAVADGMAFTELMRGAAKRTVQLEVERAGRIVALAVTPELDAASGRGVAKVMLSQPVEMITVTSGPVDAVAKGAERTWETSVMTLKMIGKMVTGEASWKNVTGPITIADYAGQTARIGLATYLQFIAFISISLGVMNLLPIPVLDGGHLLYYSLEVLTGRPLPARIGEYAQRLGVGLLFVLMALAVFNDLVRLL
ncbi:RIP metalloprotease RseP [Massilia yuzhufengensis]|uniref:Zinc metalloprotease n=1 Tax=Massilia yuzhufengensis TaxID=1164594 RepID=A0A1I1JFQ2_9BURK|nr:RIP metalloprotease RseP [Massilia yuzhufengensis]SFC44270.1 regulator of sigma E protease [Massilia yuzhufengensis]